MSQLFPILLLILTSGICLDAFFVCLHAFFPRLLERTASCAAERAGRSILIGLVNGLFLAAVGIALVAIGQNTGRGLYFLLALLIGLVLVIGVLFGTTAMVLLLKERLFPGQVGNRPLALAGGVATLACLTPYIGWFGLFAYILFRGTGAFVITLVELRRESRMAQVADNIEEE